MKRSYWSLFAILMMAMLSFGIISCSNDEGDDLAESKKTTPAVLTLGGTSIACDNAYYRKDVLLGEMILHTFYFTSVDILKSWNGNKYDQIAIHFTSNDVSHLDTVVNLTLWAVRTFDGELIQKSEEPAHIKFDRVNDLYSISVDDIDLLNSNYGKSEVSFTFCNKMHQFSDAEKVEASSGKYNLCYYAPIEQAAEFPGGNDAFITWINKNVRYPAAAQEQGIQGRVAFSFVVGRDGYIVDVTVTQSPDPILSNEVVRLMKGCPRWKPAMQGGNFVRSRYTTSINFTLN